MHAKARGGAKISKREDTLAHQKPEERRKWHITGKGNSNNNGTGEPEDVWTDNEAELPHAGI